MKYFSEMPLTSYPNLVTNDNTYVALTNIMTRSAFLREITENVSLFYDYQVKDGETPEIIADKLYGDPSRFWIVLMFNGLNNPYYDFPLISEQLNDMIVSKYEQTLEDSKTTIHHYEATVVRKIYYNGMLNFTNEETYVISAQQQNANTGLAEDRPILPGTADTSLPGETYTEDFGSGVTVTTEYTYSAVSNYTYEVTENEKRRSIKLLDAAYVGNVESEFRRLMRDGN